MHGYNFIQWLIWTAADILDRNMVNEYVMGIPICIDDHDAMGLILMGGEL